MKNKKGKKNATILSEEKLDALTEKYGPWNRLAGKRLTPEQVSLISQCMTENLEHCRHVENEKMTFSSIFLAALVGIMAFTESDGTPAREGALLVIYICLLFLLLVAYWLTARWNRAFERHLFYATKCYDLLHRDSMGKRKTKTEEEELLTEFHSDLNEFPFYCFRIRDSERKFSWQIYRGIRTKTLYKAFYVILGMILAAAIALQVVTIAGIV